MTLKGQKILLLIKLKNIKRITSNFILRKVKMIHL